MDDTGPQSTPALPAGLAEDVPWLLARAAFTLGTQLLTMLESELGIPPRAYTVLTAAAEAEQTQKALADAVGLDRTTMVTTIDELESQGLVERRPAPGDRRARIIVPTPAGRDLARRAERVVRRVEHKALSGLPTSDRQFLITALQQLVTTTLSDPVDCSDVPHPPRRRQPRPRT